MVRRQVIQANMYSTYHLKPGQTLENTKISERKLALIASESAFQRFVDYVNQPQRLAEEREVAKAKLNAIRKATYEMSKTWDNTVENIKRRRKEELLNKRKIEEEKRKEFVKEMTAKNAAERAEIVRQARTLLLYKQPQCRRINRAMLVSECLRELNAQVEFQKTIKQMDDQQENEYVELIKKDVEKYEQEEKKKIEERKMKIEMYAMKLKNQIDENAKIREIEKNEEFKIEIQDRLNINRDLQIMKESQAKEELKRKKELQKDFLKSIDEKKRAELESKRKEKFEDLAIDIYNRSKSRIKKMLKERAQKEKQSREQRANFIGEKFATLMDSTGKIEKEKVNFAKAVDEIEKNAIERYKTRKDYEIAMRAVRIEDKRNDDAVKIKLQKDEKDMQTWETLQRFKRDEYNKQVELNDRIEERNRKINYARDLKKHMELQKEEREYQNRIDDDFNEMKGAIKQDNERVLSYSQQALEESKGVRPLYPILKAIQECKEEIGLIKPKLIKPISPKKFKRIRGIRRGPCTKIVEENKIHYMSDV
ncbi:PREDICTED: meiosis-specific nuclear structural protein 1-like [Polistes dominula]|uniref:Meiosis-specific nuclear structural protein 1-like n=1 Tax=Polistes dominula TaxID=743375 RepID=A0ABM1HU03_POLDO|nr:PREDICTED: meiosis-specific nuclear structural protein 1-like [Polistes dominula]